ncbi:hypothetical protein CYMTET_12194 [Cymbomonas tetramitiformis]|uniref:Fibronectin type-III domain-containing protein n=1 Tax=Cymbomonas tetramitiformis TaxID=36881 RepID=A0AAE0LC31_9CHLO|nr:hypothetical protein CYMTET_12194 [Cymbomonas tetramitiformis]
MTLPRALAEKFQMAMHISISAISFLAVVIHVSYQGGASREEGSGELWADFGYLKITSPEEGFCGIFPDVFLCCTGPFFIYIKFKAIRCCTDYSFQLLLDEQMSPTDEELANERKRIGETLMATKLLAQTLGLVSLLLSSTIYPSVLGAAYFYGLVPLCIHALTTQEHNLTTKRFQAIQVVVAFEIVVFYLAQFFDYEADWLNTLGLENLTRHQEGGICISSAKYWGFLGSQILVAASLCWCRWILTISHALPRLRTPVYIDVLHTFLTSYNGAMICIRGLLIIWAITFPGLVSLPLLVAGTVHPMMWTTAKKSENAVLQDKKMRDWSNCLLFIMHYVICYALVILAAEYLWYIPGCSWGDESWWRRLGIHTVSRSYVVLFLKIFLAAFLMMYRPHISQLYRMPGFGGHDPWLSPTKNLNGTHAAQKGASGGVSLPPRECKNKTSVESVRKAKGLRGVLFWTKRYSVVGVHFLTGVAVRKWLIRSPSQIVLVLAPWIYSFSILVLYLASLTQATVLNGGLLLFVIAFTIISYEEGTHRWHFVMVYIALLVYVLFTWQIIAPDVTNDYDMSGAIGLEVYKPQEDLWAPLWITPLMQYILLLTVVGVQTAASAAVWKKRCLDGYKHGAYKRQGTMVLKQDPRIGLLFAMPLMLCLGVLYPVFNRATLLCLTDLLVLIGLVVLLVFDFKAHHFVQYRRLVRILFPYLLVQYVWLMLIYICQIEHVFEMLESVWWPLDRYLPLPNLGLVQHLGRDQLATGISVRVTLLVVILLEYKWLAWTVHRYRWAAKVIMFHCKRHKQRSRPEHEEFTINNNFAGNAMLEADYDLISENPAVGIERNNSSDCDALRRSDLQIASTSIKNDGSTGNTGNTMTTLEMAIENARSLDPEALERSRSTSVRTNTLTMAVRTRSDTAASAPTTPQVDKARKKRLTISTTLRRHPRVIAPLSFTLSNGNLSLPSTAEKVSTFIANTIFGIISCLGPRILAMFICIKACAQVDFRGLVYSTLLSVMVVRVGLENGTWEIVGKMWPVLLAVTTTMSTLLYCYQFAVFGTGYPLGLSSDHMLDTNWLGLYRIDDPNIYSMFAYTHACCDPQYVRFRDNTTDIGYACKFLDDFDSDSDMALISEAYVCTTFYSLWWLLKWELFVLLACFMQRLNVAHTRNLQSVRTKRFNQIVSKSKITKRYSGSGAGQTTPRAAEESSSPVSAPELGEMSSACPPASPSQYKSKLTDLKRDEETAQPHAPAMRNSAASIPGDVRRRHSMFAPREVSFESRLLETLDLAIMSDDVRPRSASSPAGPAGTSADVSLWVSATAPVIYESTSNVSEGDAEEAGGRSPGRKRCRDEMNARTPALVLEGHTLPLPPSSGPSIESSTEGGQANRQQESVAGLGEQADKEVVHEGSANGDVDEQAMQRDDTVGPADGPTPSDGVGGLAESDESLVDGVRTTVRQGSRDAIAGGPGGARAGETPHAHAGAASMAETQTRIDAHALQGEERGDTESGDSLYFSMLGSTSGTSSSMGSVFEEPAKTSRSDQSDQRPVGAMTRDSSSVGWFRKPHFRKGTLGKGHQRSRSADGWTSTLDRSMTGAMASSPWKPPTTRPSIRLKEARPPSLGKIEAITRRWMEARDKSLVPRAAPMNVMIKWVSHLQALGTQVWNFIMLYYGIAAYEAAMLSLLLTAFMHMNIMSLLYMGILGLMVGSNTVVGRQRLAAPRYRRAFLGTISVMNFAQYVIKLGLPPVFLTDYISTQLNEELAEEDQPEEEVSEQVSEEDGIVLQGSMLEECAVCSAKYFWILVTCGDSASGSEPCFAPAKSSYNLITDFMVLFFAVEYVKQTRADLEAGRLTNVLLQPTVSPSVRSSPTGSPTVRGSPKEPRSPASLVTSPLSSVASTPHALYQSAERHVQDENDMTMQKSLWHQMQFFCMNNFIYIIITSLFLIAMANRDSNIFNLGYAMIGCLFTFRIGDLERNGLLFRDRQQSKKWWNPALFRVLLFYNYAVLTVKLFFCIPGIEPIYLDGHKATSGHRCSQEGNAGTSMCELWTEIFGLQKLDNSCDGVSCGDTFSLNGGGIMGSLIVFVLTQLQQQIFTHPVYTVYMLSRRGYFDREKVRRREMHQSYISSLVAARTKSTEALLDSRQKLMDRLYSVVKRQRRWESEQFGPLQNIFPPAAPSQPRVEVLNSVSLEVHWDAPESFGQAILWYTLKRQVASTTTLLGDFGDPQDVHAHSCSAVVTGLEPDTAYEFIVEAVNIEGRGTPSNRSSPVSTLPSTPMEEHIEKEEIDPMDSLHEDEVFIDEMIVHDDESDADDLDAEDKDRWAWVAELRENARQQFNVTWAFLVRQMAAGCTETLFPHHACATSQSISTLLEFLGLLWALMRSHTQLACCGIFVVNAMANADLLSLVFPVCMFLFTMVEIPQADKQTWQMYTCYAIFVIFVRITFQLQLFCMRDTISDVPGQEGEIDDPDRWWPSMQPNCPKEGEEVYHAPSDYSRKASIFAVVKKPNSATLLGHYFTDALVLMMLYIHIYHMDLLGCWKANAFLAIQPKFEPIMINHWPTQWWLGRRLREAEVAIRNHYMKVMATDHIMRDIGKKVPTVPPPTPLRLSASAARREGLKNAKTPFRQKKLGSYLMNFNDIKATDFGAQLVGKPGMDLHMPCLRPLVGKPGMDLHMPSFVFQLITLLYFIFFSGYFVTTSSTFLEDLNNNQFSPYIVMAMLIGVLVMILDRIAYLQELVGLKLVLHYTCVITMHYYVFVYIPTAANDPNLGLSKNSYLQLFYLLLVVNFSLGAVQLREGYLQGSQYAIGVMSGTGAISRFIYKIYISCPFLFEMRSILDWVCSDTSLDLFMWLIVERIYSNLWMNKLEMAYRKEWDQVLSGKSRIPTWFKFLMGVSTFIGLVIMLVIPVVLFSSLNPSLSENKIASSKMTVMLYSASEGFFPLYDQRQSQLTDMTGDDYNQLLRIMGTGLHVKHTKQCIVYDKFSRSYFDIPQTGINSLVRELTQPNLNESNAVQIQMEINFKRRGPPEAQIVNDVYKHILDSDQRWQMARMLTTYPYTDEPLYIKELYPMGLRLTTGTEIKSLDINSDQRYKVGIELQVMYSPTQFGGAPRSYWSVKNDNIHTQLLATADDDDDDQTNGELCQDADEDFAGVAWACISDNFFEGIVETLGLPSYGIIGVYTLILVTISSLVRQALFVSYEQILFREMQDCTDLLEVCEGIHTLRAQDYPGRLKDEVKLYQTLIKMTRSPETLIRITRTREQLCIECKALPASVQDLCYFCSKDR